MQAWYVAKVKPKKERQVQEYLARFGVEVYSPEILAVRRGRKRVEPLFASYVFVRTDPTSDLWPLVCWARGVSYVLGDKWDPMPCPDGMLDTLRARVEQWNVRVREATFFPGDRVLLQTGPFRELEAIFQRYVSGRERCHVLLSFMGRSLTVTMKVAEIGNFSLRQLAMGPV